AAIAAVLGREADDLACSALARFVLEVPALAATRHDPLASVETVFDLLIHGWQASQLGSGKA
ncbi:TetR/AcrR family transcriptional regulator, partial [Streptomyces sp. NPDC002666]